MFFKLLLKFKKVSHLWCQIGIPFKSAYFTTTGLFSVKRLQIDTDICLS